MGLKEESIGKGHSFLGQKTYQPKLMLSLLFYGYATGVRSSCKLEEKCISDHIYICLMEGYRPDHRAISDLKFFQKGKDKTSCFGSFFLI